MPVAARRRAAKKVVTDGEPRSGRSERRKRKEGTAKMQKNLEYNRKEEEVKQGATVANVTGGARRPTAAKKQDEQLRTEGTLDAKNAK